MRKEQVIEALRRFVSQRSGMDYRNYGERESFMGDYRPILRAGRDARILLGAVNGRDGITVENIVAATRAYAGRLTLKEREGKVAVDYCTGQYFPTEYRNAACAVLATALWDYALAQGYKTGESIRKWARGEFGRGIATRWFN